jgi:uncharacterized protein (TIGR02270 family)
MDPAAGAPDERIIWSVVEEHLDELEFAISQLERTFDHPLRTLAELETGVEARLAAHLDALVIAGPEVLDKLIAPVLEDPPSAAAERVAAAALALVTLGRLDPFAALLGHEHAGVRAAAARGAALAADGLSVDAWALARLGKADGANAHGLLDLAAGRALETPPLLGWLQSDDPHVTAAAARACRRANGSFHLPVVNHLLTHADRAVKGHALVAALAWSSPAAWAACEQDAFAKAPSPAALALYALLGGPNQHEKLFGLLTSAAHRTPVLRVLGLTGNLKLVPRLLDIAGDDKKPDEAKLAGQAIALLTGLDLRDDAFLSPPPKGKKKERAEARAALPPFDEDDLDANLVPPPEAELPIPNRDAIARWWTPRASRLDHERRHLTGYPFSLDAVLKFLAGGPLGARHAIGLLFGVLTAGRLWIDTRAPSRRQRAQLTAAREGLAKLPPNRFGW